MSTTENQLFTSVPKTDYFQMFEGNRVQSKKVAEFLNLKKSDVSAALGVPQSSIRWDDRLPDELAQRLTEWATAINLVGSYFKDADKTHLWFQIPNPMLGNVTPRDMIRAGRFSKLLNFIQTALGEGQA